MRSHRICEYSVITRQISTLISLLSQKKFRLIPVFHFRLCAHLSCEGATMLGIVDAKVGGMQ